jgi:hypothetical protein
LLRANGPAANGQARNIFWALLHNEWVEFEVRSRFGPLLTGVL